MIVYIAKLLSTGTLNNMHSLMLVAEGMVVANVKAVNILNAVICLLANYYAFNAEYPKGVTGHSKNVFLFLRHVMIPCSGKKKFNETYLMNYCFQASFNWSMVILTYFK